MQYRYQRINEGFLHDSLYGSKCRSVIRPMPCMAVTTDYLDSLNKDNLPDLEDASRREFAGIV